MRREDLERTHEWLRNLTGDHGRLAELLLDAGGMAGAAYRLARAQRRRQSLPERAPTLRDVRSAARAIALSLGGDNPSLSSRALAAECLRLGVPVTLPKRCPRALHSYTLRR